MKKILGMSLFAFAAVTPLMANASDVTLVPVTPAWAMDQLATTSYVNGAYNILGGHINTKQDKLTAGENAVNTTVKTSATISETAEAASDTALATEKAVMTAIEAARSSASGDTDAIVEQIGDEELDTTKQTLTGAINEVFTGVGENAAAIEVLNGDSEQEGSVDYKIANAIESVNGATSGIGERVEAIEDVLGDGTTDGLIKDVADNTDAIDSLSNKQIKYVSDWSTNTVRTMALAELPNPETGN